MGLVLRSVKAVIEQSDRGFVAELRNDEVKLGRVSVGYGTEYGFLEEALRL